MRLSTIAIDSRAEGPPAQWTGAWVQRRLIEAYAVERRLPQQRRRVVASAWPPMQVEFADILGRADDARAQAFDAWQYSDAGVSAADISKMEQAHDWLRVILSPHPEERLCLGAWAAAIAYRKSLRRLLLQRGWARSTFYRYVTAGSHVIAVELQRQECPIS